MLLSLSLKQEGTGSERVWDLFCVVHTSVSMPYLCTHTSLGKCDIFHLSFYFFICFAVFLGCWLYLRYTLLCKWRGQVFSGGSFLSDRSLNLKALRLVLPAPPRAGMGNPVSFVSWDFAWLGTFFSVQWILTICCMQGTELGSLMGHKMNEKWVLSSSTLNSKRKRQCKL